LGANNPAYGRKRPDLALYNKQHIVTGPDHPAFGKHFNLGIKRSLETRKKMKCAAILRGQDPVWREKMRQQRLKQVMPQNNSLPERLLQNAFSEREIGFYPQYIIERFEIDIAFPDEKIAVEVDGNYWHNFPHGLPRDRKKDARLSEIGWKVFRFWESDIKVNVGNCVDIIEKALEESRGVNYEHTK